MGTLAYSQQNATFPIWDNEAFTKMPRNPKALTHKKQNEGRTISSIK